MFPERAFRILTDSIPARVLAALLSMYVLTYGATAIVVFSGVRESLLQSDATALNHVADLKYEQLANQLGAFATDLTAWSELEVMNDLASGDIDKRVTQALDTLKRLYSLPGDIYAFNASGKLLASSADTFTGKLPDNLPPEWHGSAAGLSFIDKHRDPVTSNQVVALELPVFGTFGSNYRIGTLVLTVPWSSIEAVLFSTGNGTILMEKTMSRQVLAASPPELVGRIGLERLQQDGVEADGTVVGQSAPRTGIIANWQVLMLHDTANVTRALNWVACELMLLGAALGLPILLLGRWLSRRLTAPIADLTRVVREIADTDKLDGRVPVTSADELGSLAQSFNRMTANLERTTREREEFLRELAALNQSLEEKIAARTEELEAAVDAQKRLLGDISHEIKSPLARLSMALGLARRSTESNRPRQFDRMEREIETIAALASELLILARLDAAMPVPEFEIVDIRLLIEEIVRDAYYESPDRKSDLLLLIGSSPAAVYGNPDLLRRAIENVVRNAIFYTDRTTRIEIVISHEAAASVCIQVRDYGPGVPEPALLHLFEPFYRVDEARARTTGGTGIGLAICQRVVSLHGGTVRAIKNEPTGLIIEMTFPASEKVRGKIELTRGWFTSSVAPAVY